MDPFEVHIAGQKVGGWTSAKLKRDRKKLTGELTLECFFGSIPASPVLREVKSGAEILCYVGGQVAFTGKIDRRNGRGKKKKGENDDATFKRSVSIGKDAYTITVTARGKTKRIIDSSHAHKTGSMKQVSPSNIIAELAKPFGVEVDDQAGETDKVERAVFRDGASADSEITRWGTEANLETFETREGKLAIRKPGNEPRGVDLVLGVNILEFSADQGEDTGNSEITVKGQRTDPKIHGKDAINRKLQAKLPGNMSFSPLVIQLTGDATDVRLKNRAKVETRKRQEGDKEITIDVFHVQSPTGEPWDINVVHYVEIPPENIFDDFVVNELTYEVHEKDKLKTTLTLVPATKAEGKGGRSDSKAKGDAQRAALGVKNDPKLYPDTWDIKEPLFG